MKTNTAWILAGLGCIIGIMWLCNHDKRVRQNTPTNYVLTDTSTLLKRQHQAEDDKKADKWQSEKLHLLEENERLQSKIDAMKPIYHNLIEGMGGLSKFKVDSFGTITYNGQKYLKSDSSCMKTLFYSDQYIGFLDSTLQVKSKGLDSCFNRIGELELDVKYHKDLSTKCCDKNLNCFIELSKFHHWFWRIYRKVR